MSLALPLSTPFYTGTGTSSDVPWVYPAALDGRPFLIDDKPEQMAAWALWYHESIPLQRTQADTSATPGEQTLNRDGLWRFSTETWHKGAGQTYADRADSDAARFNTSKGVDVWTKWKLGLLADTTSRRASANTNLQLEVAGSYLYAVDGTEVYWTQDVTVAPTWTAAVIQAGEAAQSVKSICSDGNTVYAALGSNGVHTTTRGTVSSSHYSALSCTLVAYVKGRLMAANGNAIYNITASGAAPSALLTQPNTDFTWVGFAEGSGHIYAAGYSGDKSLVYRTAVKSDGTALDIPVVAGQLPDGEIVRSIVGYLGFILLGTDKGVRLAEADTNGNLQIGGYITTPAPVRCFEGQAQFVWYGLSNYDASSTGLGRLDLETINDTAPAYASDLMAAGQGTVLSVATFQNVRVFAVSGLGVYAETTSKVSSGTCDSGLVGYGIADEKMALFEDLRHQPLPTGASVAIALAADGGAFASAGSSAVAATSGNTVPLPQTLAELFEVRLTLSRATDTTTGPTVTRATLRVNPSVDLGEYLFVPLLLNKVDRLEGGDERPRDPVDELAHIKELHASRKPVVYQEGVTSYTVTVNDYRWRPLHPTGDGGWSGTCGVQLKRMENA